MRLVSVGESLPTGAHAFVREINPAVVIGPFQQELCPPAKSRSDFQNTVGRYETPNAGENCGKPFGLGASPRSRPFVARIGPFVGPVPSIFVPVKIWHFSRLKTRGRLEPRRRGLSASTQVAVIGRRGVVSAAPPAWFCFSPAISAPTRLPLYRASKRST